ncbi:hypothetical protein NHX12_027718 [Muraenolepis orangiensis]|uniref:Uncharacterized protein n=1 Tax=Muraenolepis orangiensis TaxID=630683 RepID=A0A9Q0EHG5_9TELE|nr:hypothetical protein NHX12_027718 [Muraenolepis orangiensis]
MEASVDVYLFGPYGKPFKRTIPPAMSDEGCPSPPPPKQSTIMSPQEAATGKKAQWSQLEITGGFSTVNGPLWTH